MPPPREEHFQEQLDGRAARLDVREQLLSSVEFARWQYLRMRLLHAIPPTRNDVEDRQWLPLTPSGVDSSASRSGVGSDRAVEGGTEVADRTDELPEEGTAWWLRRHAELPKQPSPEEFKQIRPIAVLESSSKLLSRILRQVSEGLEVGTNSPGQLDNCMLGFRKGHQLRRALEC